ncbi:MAG: hypothetical protein ACOX30_02290 [Dethiobacteria bacterium]
MSKKKALLVPLLTAALFLFLTGCAAEEPAALEQGAGGAEQLDTALPQEGEPGYYAFILLPKYWGEGTVLEGSLESGYLLVGFNVPAGISLYAPFEGTTGAVSLEPYHSEDAGSYEGCSLCAPGSLNGFSAYNVSAVVEGSVKKDEVFAEVTSDEYIFPEIYGRVNLILEFNLFDREAAGYGDLHTLFEEIFKNILEDGTW